MGDKKKENGMRSNLMVEDESISAELLLKVNNAN